MGDPPWVCLWYACNQRRLYMGTPRPQNHWCKRWLNKKWLNWTSAKQFGRSSWCNAGEFFFRGFDWHTDLPALTQTFPAFSSDAHMWSRWVRVPGCQYPLIVSKISGMITAGVFPTSFPISHGLSPAAWYKKRTYNYLTNREQVWYWSSRKPKN